MTTAERMELSSFNFITDTFPTENHKYLRAVAVAYAFGIVKFVDLRNALQRIGWEDDRPSVLSKQFKNDRVLNKTAKVYLMLVASGDSSAARKVPLSNKDKTQLRAVLSYPTIGRRVAALAHNHKVWTEGELDRRVAAVLTHPNFTNYLKRFTFRKHRFLAAHGQQLDDIESQIIEFCVHSLYRSYPNFTDMMHMLNVAKRSARHHGINIIYDNTRQKRNVYLGQDQAGRQTMMVVSYDDPNVQTFLDSQSRGTADQSAPEIESAERSMCFDSLGSKLRSGQQRFLKLVRGQYDAEFSAWLGERNDVMIHEWSFDQTLATVCDYLGVTKKAASRFVTTLRCHF